MFNHTRSNQVDLRTALHNIHADPFWWRKVLIGGALMLTGVGATWPAGLVVESMENVGKGYPTPLPPSADVWTRCIIGLFALVIDFFFFVLPVLFGGLLLFCGLAGLALTQTGAVTLLVGQAVGALLGLLLLFLFAVGIAPVARLAYIADGRAEAALTPGLVRNALGASRRAYGRARLHSLPGYAPMLLLAAITWLVARSTLPGGWLLTALLIWLTLSALIYAHLVVAQLYGALVRTS